MLITDLVMPGMSGRELGERLLAERPGLPVLYISGYIDDEAVQRGLLPAGGQFLAKPFDHRVLVTRVRALLPGRSGPDA